MKRCLETARKGLAAAVRRGVKIQVMPALAGREGARPWDLQETDGSWVMERLGPRDRRTKDSEYVMRWSKLQDLDFQEARMAREVVVVTQGQLLAGLLGSGKSTTSSFFFTGIVLLTNERTDYKGTDFPNAVVRSYVVRTIGKTTQRELSYLPTIDEIYAYRACQRDWPKHADSKTGDPLRCFVWASAHRKKFLQGLKLEREKREKKRLKKERLKTKKIEQAKLEAKLLRERPEKEILEEKREKEKLDKKKLMIERLEKVKQKTEQAERERIEKEKIER
jgi:hypothetical protein